MGAAAAWLVAKVKGAWPWLVAAGAALAALLGALDAARRSGRRDEQLREAARDLAAEKERRNTDATVSRMPDADLDRELGKWVRPPRP